MHVWRMRHCFLQLMGCQGETWGNSEIFNFTSEVYNAHCQWWMIHSHTIKWLGTEKFWTAARDRMRTLNSCTLYNIASRLLYLISMYVFMRGCLTCSSCCISGGLWLLCRGWTVEGLHWSHSGSQGEEFCFEVCHHISSINCYFVYIVLWYTTSGILWSAPSYVPKNIQNIP